MAHLCQRYFGVKIRHTSPWIGPILTTVHADQQWEMSWINWLALQYCMGSLQVRPVYWGRGGTFLTFRKEWRDCHPKQCHSMFLMFPRYSHWGLRTIQENPPLRNVVFLPQVKTWFWFSFSSLGETASSNFSTTQQTLYRPTTPYVPRHNWPLKRKGSFISGGCCYIFTVLWNLGRDRDKKLP